MPPEREERSIQHPIDATSKSTLNKHIDTLSARTDKKGVVLISLAPDDQKQPTEASRLSIWTEMASHGKTTVQLSEEHYLLLLGI